MRGRKFQSEQLSLRENYSATQIQFGIVRAQKAAAMLRADKESLTRSSQPLKERSEPEITMEAVGKLRETLVSVDARAHCAVNEESRCERLVVDTHCGFVADVRVAAETRRWLSHRWQEICLERGLQRWWWMRNGSVGYTRCMV